MHTGERPSGRSPFLFTMLMMETGASRQVTSARVVPLGAQVNAGRVALALGAILCVAVLSRWWGLGAKSLWFDEAYSVFVAEQPLAAIPGLLRTYDTHPPLHYIILHLWIALFGKSEAAVRAPSLLAGLALVALTFSLTRRMAGERTALLAALLVALSPFQIMASQEARMYPFLAAFGLGASSALWRALEQGQPRQWIAYALFVTLALYTHHFAFLIVLAHAAYLLAFHRGTRPIRAWAGSMGAAFVATLPYLPLLLAQVETARGWPIIRAPISLRGVTDLAGMFGFGGGLFGMGTYFKGGDLPLQYRAALLLPFLLLVLAGASGLGRRKASFLLTYWLMPVAIVVLISLRVNIFYERYFSFVVPPFAMLLAAGVLAAADGLRGRGRTAATVGLLALLGSFILPALADLYRAPPVYDWKAAARYLTTRAQATDFILYIPAFARVPFEYYYHGPQERMSLNPGVVPAGKHTMQVRTEVDTERMAQIARTHPRMWIVATIPIGYEARTQIAVLLAPYFREVDGWRYGQVYTFLWESRVYSRPGAPPPTGR